MTDYAAKVAEGIKFLDSDGPANWRQEINLDSLRLESCEVCVLGQVFGSYDNGLENLDIQDSSAYRYGFNTNGSMTELTQAWKDALGKNNTLVEMDDIYSDTASGTCCTVRVVGTKSVEISPGKSEMVYIVQSGTVIDRKTFKPYDVKQVAVLFKKDFEAGGLYPTKVELVKPLALKKGMFVTNDTGKVWYVVDPYWVREVADQAEAKSSGSIAGSKGLREVTTYNGTKFSNTITI